MDDYKHENPDAEDVINEVLKILLRANDAGKLNPYDIGACAVEAAYVAMIHSFVMRQVRVEGELQRCTTPTFEWVSNLADWLHQIAEDGELELETPYSGGAFSIVIGDDGYFTVAATTDTEAKPQEPGE